MKGLKNGRYPHTFSGKTQTDRTGLVFEMNVNIFQKQISLQLRISLTFLFVSLVGCAGSLPLEGQITNIEIQ
jgi:hypothetical protein